MSELVVLEWDTKHGVVVWDAEHDIVAISDDKDNNENEVLVTGGRPAPQPRNRQNERR